MKVEVIPDCLDYVEAFGALGSLALALVAAWFAWKSAHDSGRSASAAEATANAAAEEAVLSRQMVERLEEQLDIERELQEERARRPVLEAPTLTFLGRLEPNELSVGLLRELGVQLQLGRRVHGLYPVIVRAEFLNSGNRDASQMRARVAVPEGLVPLTSGPRGEHPTRTALSEVDDLMLSSPDGPVRAVEFSWRVAHMPPDQPEAMHLILILRKPGAYEVRLGADHGEADAAESHFVVSQDGVRAVETDEG